MVVVDCVATADLNAKNLEAAIWRWRDWLDVEKTERRAGRH